MSRDRQADFERFRREFPTFVYETCGLEMEESGFAVELAYRVDGGPRFASRYAVELPPAIASGAAWSESRAAGVAAPRAARLAFYLGLVDAISYWKCVCSPTLVLEAGSLGADEAAWWRRLYHRGLGEFRYVNGIEVDEEAFVAFESAADGAAGVGRRGPRPTDKHHNLILVGGGKDSVVSLELLAGRRERNTCLALNPRTATLETVRLAGYGTAGLIRVERPIDLRLLELNARGYLNGHTPFSAILAFLGVLVAEVTGHRNVIASNESSASEGNVAGAAINHQYSKSFEFERGFRAYVARHLPTEVEYFSLLRPWNELRIAREFARHPEYFDAFRSCNAGSFDNRWCGACPKCLFVYLMLAPFVGGGRLREVFGGDPLAREALRDVFLGLVDAGRDKPFECVGTREEANAAARELVRQYRQRGEELPVLLAEYARREGDDAGEVFGPGFAALVERLDAVHAVPDSYLALLEAAR